MGGLRAQSGFPAEYNRMTTLGRKHQIRTCTNGGFSRAIESHPHHLTYSAAPLFISPPLWSKGSVERFAGLALGWRATVMTMLREL